jgi:D-3-phosphoglycerate dehydrogenase
LTTTGQQNAVITDCDHATVDPERRVLDEAGIALRLEHCRTSEDVARAATDADGLLVQYARVDDDALAALPRLRVVVRYGVGVDTIDVEAAARRGVWVCNVPDYGTQEVSDHALALLLSLARGVARQDREVRGGRWDVNAVRPLRRISTLTLGVVGLGRIGAALARKAQAVGFSVVGHDPRGLPDELRELGVREAGLDELWGSVDAVSLHLPLTPESRHLLGERSLERLRPGALVVNTSRGGLVDAAALLRALEDGRVGGAGLDVLEHEPPGEDERALVVHERVVVTPHSAWYSEESELAMKTDAASEVARVLGGEAPRSPVNEPEDRARG